MATIHLSGVRWARGAVVALLAVLVVLVHHETAAITPPAQHTVRSAHAGHAMPGMTPSPVTAPRHSSPNPMGTHGTDSSACAGSGMQHCTTASVETVQLVPPPQGFAEPAADPHQAMPGRSPAGTISRAPPDLSVLSQLRI